MKSWHFWPNAPSTPCVWLALFATTDSRARSIVGRSTVAAIQRAGWKEKAAANVISLYSNTYTNRTVDTWSAIWDNADVTDTIISGNDTKIYSNLVFAGIEFTSSVINATAMTHFHVDIWTPNATNFNIKLVDFGANGVYDGGDDREHELSFTPTLNGWNSYDIPLSNFTNLTTRAHLAQLILVSSNSKVYVDNIYFYNSPTTTPSITAAPVPTKAAANVISLYSNTYTNRTVDTWSAIWDNADVTDTLISGNDTKIYSNLNFAGIEFTSNVINANAMTHFHVDIWTPNSTTFNVKLVDFGANGVYAGGDDKEHELSFTPTLNGWNSYDIPLSNFTNMTTRAHLAQLILVGSNSKAYIDNVYLYTTATIPVELTVFKAKLSNNTTILDWQTASEHDNKSFDIERSNEGTTYTAIGQVKGNGTTNTPHNYTFTDKDPSTGINYYRLRQTDFDGKETLSKQVSIVFNKSGLVIKVNLNTNTIDVTAIDEKTRTLSIYNMVGQQVMVEKVQGSKTVDIRALAIGSYIIQTDKGDVARFVKP